MKSLVCPHCHTTVPERASVCVGCGAEIIRGATRRERAGAGCAVAGAFLFIALAIIGMRPLPPPSSDDGFFLVLKLASVIVVGNILGRLIMRWLRRASLRFFRSYENH
jgi:hypothetical protein